MQANANRVDLAIVGGGPTGLAVAIHARLAGLTATVFDRSRPPIDRACGDGLALAFHQARAFVEAFRENRLEDYEIEHRRILRGPTTMTRLLLALDRLPSLRRRVIRALAADPGLFDSLLSLHARESSIQDLGFGFLTRFALRMASA